MAKKAEEKEDDGLVEMINEGVVIRVHPDQIAGWETQGWKVVE